MSGILERIEAKLDLALTPPPPPPPPPGPKQRLGVVSYFRSTTAWDATLAAKPAVCMINPGSGPGPAPDSLYVGLVPKCKAAGVPVLGYVHTKYGARPIAEVKADIDKHYSFYGVDGIFIDTTSNLLSTLAYYAELSAHVRAKGGLVVLNPGTKTLEAFVGLADHIMVSETDAATYRGQVRPAWEAKYPASKFWHAVHTCSAGELDEILALSKARNAGVVFVTDDVMTNPYDRLPVYWADLVAKVA